MTVMYGAKSPKEVFATLFEATGLSAEDMPEFPDSLPSTVNTSQASSRTASSVGSRGQSPLGARTFTAEQGNNLQNVCLLVGAVPAHKPTKAEKKRNRRSRSRSIRSGITAKFNEQITSIVRAMPSSGPSEIPSDSDAAVGPIAGKGTAIDTPDSGLAAKLPTRPSAYNDVRYTGTQLAAVEETPYLPERSVLPSAWDGRFGANVGSAPLATTDRGGPSPSRMTIP